QERVDEMRSKREAELKELKAAHAEELRRAAEEHQAALEKARKDHAEAVAALQVAAREAAEKHAAELREAQAALQRERERVAELQARAQALQGELQAAQSALAALGAKLEAAEKSHAEILAQKDEAFAREKRGLKEKHKLETERLLEAQIQETQDLKDRFDRARQLQEAQVDMLQGRLAELQRLYDSRPPRPEDLDRIAALQAELEQRTQEIKRLNEEMHFYK
ncbi:unnamed protein product, partial [Prorocentrum cordatum]